MALISRFNKWTGTKQLPLTINNPPMPGTDVGKDKEIPYSEFAGGMVYIPANSPITQLTYWVAGRTLSDPDANTPAQQANPVPTIYQAYNLLGVALTQNVVPGGAYPLPVELFAAGAIFITVSNGLTAGPIEFSAKG